MAVTTLYHSAIGFLFKKSIKIVNSPDIIKALSNTKTKEKKIIIEEY